MPSTVGGCSKALTSTLPSISPPTGRPNGMSTVGVMSSSVAPAIVASCRMPGPAS